MSNRTEVISLRLTAEEKQRLVEAAERARLLAEATGQPAKSLSDWAREQLVKHADDPVVSPGQNITVTLQAPSTGANGDILAERIRRVLQQHGIRGAS